MDDIVVLSNHVDWGYITLKKLEQKYNAKIVTKKYPCTDSKLDEFVWTISFSDKTKAISPKFIKTNRVLSFMKQYSLLHGSPVIIIYDHNRIANDEIFLRYLKAKNPNLKLVYVFTNIVKYTAANDLSYIDRLNDWYDVVFAFDPEDAKKYEFAYSPLIYDADPSYDKLKLESKEDLVFYVGQAKDRLSGLLSCYEKLESLGIKTDFHIAKVKEEDKRYPDKIIYNKFISYSECVDAIQHATCLIDVIQGDSTGLTIKTCEAVCYDKKLITTNKYVKEYPFYDPRYIRIVESPDDIDLAFFEENRDVHYSEEGKRYFSADRFLERLNEELGKREDNKR